MNRLLTGMASVLALGLAAAPAQAAVVCNVTGNATPQCPSTTGNNVMVTQTSNNQRVVASLNSGGRTFAGQFLGSEPLNANASGQANITAVDGSFNTLTFSLAGGTFTTATFDVMGTGTLLIQALLNGVNVGTQQSFALSANGTNFLGITAQGSELFNGFTLSGANLTDVRQVRLAGVQTAVPEPGTWAMMLVGFAAIGFSMRRRRSQASMPQMA